MEEKHVNFVFSTVNAEKESGVERNFMRELLIERFDIDGTAAEEAIQAAIVMGIIVERQLSAKQRSRLVRENILSDAEIDELIREEMYGDPEQTDYDEY